MSPLSTIRKASTFLAVLALLLARLASINGAVACFGSDGHFAFEGAHVSSDVSCSDSNLGLDQSAQPFSATVQYLIDHTHGSSCFDVAVTHAGEQQAVAASNQVPDVGAAALLSASPPDIASPEFVGTATFIRGPPADAGFLLHLRSVILLI